MKQNTIVIIASPGHSGQSWLNMLIGSHSQAVALGEISEVFGKSDLRRVCSFCEGKCDFWGRFNTIWNPEQDLFSQIADFSGKRVVSVSKIGDFKSFLNPERSTVKVIRLIRDGRAFLASISRKYPNHKTAAIVQNWHDLSVQMDRWTASFPRENGITLRYEDILKNTESCLRKICTFIGIEFESAMLEYWKVQHHVIGVNKGTLSFVKKHFGQSQSTSDNHFYSSQNPARFTDERWRTEVGPEQLKIFEKIGGRLNRLYGYSPSFSEPAVVGANEAKIDFELLLPKPADEKNLVTNAAVIIRSSGERTENLCGALLARQVKEQNIFTLKGIQPFTKTLRCMFEIGLDAGLPWTIAVDADLLPAPGAISKIIEIAENHPDNVFEVNAQMMDKLTCGPRDGGLHLFRTSFLEKAFQQIAFEGFTMRPETFVINRMRSLGYPRVKDPHLLVLHDYEQYYRDIYRKAFFHGKKHSVFIEKSLLPLWKALAMHDDDYRVALWGYRASQISETVTGSNVALFGEEIDVLLRASDLQEKEEPAGNAIDSSAIFKTLSSFQPTDEYLKFHAMMNPGQQPEKLPATKKTEPTGLKFHLTSGIRSAGYVRLLPWIVGKAFAGIGRRIFQWAEDND